MREVAFGLDQFEQVCQKANTFFHTDAGSHQRASPEGLLPGKRAVGTAEGRSLADIRRRHHNQVADSGPPEASA